MDRNGGVERQGGPRLSCYRIRWKRGSVSQVGEESVCQSGKRAKKRNSLVRKIMRSSLMQFWS